MFVVTEADATAIRAVFDQEGELSAAIELRRRFPGITDQSRPLVPLPCRGLALFDESIQCILQHFAQRHAILCRDGNKRGFNVGPDFGVELRIAPGSVIAATGIDIRHGGTRAYYAEGPDYVQMPPFETFRDAESHAATLAHELTHATKHEKRLAPDMGRIRWGDAGYAKEELGARRRLPLRRSRNHPRGSRGSCRLCGHWLKALQDDKRLIFTAAAHAQRAADYLHSLQPAVQSGRQFEPVEERAAA